MPSVFAVKGEIENPMEWYSKKMQEEPQWEYDERLKAYHSGAVYLKQTEDAVFFEDMSENEFFGQDTAMWMELADKKELVYGCYDDDGNAEFVHIKAGQCVREYRMYDFELDTDEGSSPEFEVWEDVCDFVDEHLL